MRINASITKSINLIKVKKILQGADRNTLVIFDIDDVLITPINNHDFWRPAKVIK